jgi:hypothetical protein
MTEKEIKDKIEVLKKSFPNLDAILVDYNGSGDSFDSFNYIRGLKEKEEININIDYDTDFNSLLWEILDKSDADFNNEGSEGTITIDLKNINVICENYYIEYTRVLSGKFFLLNNKE